MIDCCGVSFYAGAVEVKFLDSFYSQSTSFKECMFEVG